jgi:mycothiol synthase
VTSDSIVWTLRTLDTALQAAIEAVAAEVEHVDGAEPLNEHALLHLSSEADGLLHTILMQGPHLRGYAQLNLYSSEHDVDAEILVALGPDRAAVTSALFDAAEQTDPTGSVLVWARGMLSPVGEAAAARHYSADRVLLTMRRPLAGADTEVHLPDGVRIRAFVPGQDDEAWLGVNARAFSYHPEQGSWTVEDLNSRMTQPWFDPAGFLLAEQADGRLVGFHWTKMHLEPTGPIAEVYVLAVDPGTQHRGLGRALLAAGLGHLQNTAAGAVILYVEESNTPAVALYERGGFAVDRRDVQYRSPAR